MPFFRGGVLELVHHFRLVFHDGVAGGEELAKLRGGVVRDTGSGWHAELGRAGLRSHLDGKLLLGCQFIGVFLTPFFHGLVPLLGGGMGHFPHELLVVPHELCAPGLEGGGGLGGGGRSGGSGTLLRGGCGFRRIRGNGRDFCGWRVVCACPVLGCGMGARWHGSWGRNGFDDDGFAGACGIKFPDDERRYHKAQRDAEKQLKR